MTERSRVPQTLICTHMMMVIIMNSKRRSSSATPPQLTVTEIWLRAQGVSKKKARQFRAFDPHAVEMVWSSEISGATGTERDHKIGRLLDRWEVAPPVLPRPAASAHVWPETDDPAATARTIAPDDATSEEIAMLTDELRLDGDANRALDRLYTVRWQAAHLPALRPEVWS